MHGFWTKLLEFTTGRTGRAFPESFTFGHFVPKSEGNNVGLREGKERDGKWDVSPSR